MKFVKLTLYHRDDSKEVHQFVEAGIMYDWEIIIFPAHSENSNFQAGILMKSLQNKLIDLKCKTGDSTPVEHEGTRRMLILTSDGTPFLEDFPLLSPDVILPIFKKDSDISLPEKYQKYNAYFWRLGIQEALPLIVGKLGFFDEDVKVFISYKRTDTQKLAEQLFDRLTHEGFDVFLDRFSIEPSADFQNRLYQELADKSMVVVLESANYMKSRWVQYEVDFIRINRLGYITLNLDNAPNCPSLDAEFRYSYQTGEHLDGLGNFLDDVLEEVVNKIWGNHAYSLYLMKLYLRETVLNNMPEAELDDRGCVSVTRDNQQYCIWPFVRPPRVNEYHLVECASPSQKNIIIGPTFMEEARKNLNNWISKKVSIDFLEESQIIDLERYCQ